MKTLKKMLTIWLCISFFSIQFFYISEYAVAGITANIPVMTSSPQEDIPVEKGATPKSTGKWLWALFGAAIIAGAAALAGGLGGGDDKDEDPPSTTGSFESSW